MFSISKTIPIWLVLIAVIFINTFITAQEISPSKSGSIGPSETCVPCDNVPIKCPVCEEGTKCILTLRTCSECQKSKCVKLSPDELSENESKKADQNSNKALLPAVIGGILGVGFLAAIGYGYFVWRRRTRNERGVKLDNNEEMISVDGENVIPIAYIPTTPTTPKPEPTYTRLRISQVSGGTSPLTSPLPRLNNEQLIDIADDDDIVSDGCTILQATKTAPTATLMTATRVKPSLVRLNTIKSSNTDVNSAQSMKSGNNSIPNTPKTPMTDNTFLITPSVSSIPSSPTSNLSLVIEGDSEPEQMTPRIDIERSSAESCRVTGQNSQYLNSPSLDPIEGRQSFGLFGSDEVYSNDPSSPQLQRESILSSTSSNGRSTMFSDDGDGEITIFWGGNAPPFAGGGQIQTKKLDDQVDSTDKNQNEKTKT